MAAINESRASDKQALCHPVQIIDNNKPDHGKDKMRLINVKNEQELSVDYRNKQQKSPEEEVFDEAPQNIPEAENQEE